MPGAGIGDGQTASRAVAAGLHLDPAAGRRVLDRVVQEVGHDLPHPVAVGGDAHSGGALGCPGECPCLPRPPHRGSRRRGRPPPARGARARAAWRRLRPPRCPSRCRASPPPAPPPRDSPPAPRADRAHPLPCAGPPRRRPRSRIIGVRRSWATLSSEPRMAAIRASMRSSRALTCAPSSSSGSSVSGRGRGRRACPSPGCRARCGRGRAGAGGPSASGRSLRPRR